jgi:hypothetical protein
VLETYTGLLGSDEEDEPSESESESGERYGVEI